MAEENVTITQDAQINAGVTESVEANNISSIDADVDQANQNDSQNNPSQLNLEKLIQKAVDRATNKLGNENKKLRNQLETFKREKLTDDEIKELALKDREAEITDREAKLQEKENRLFAIKAIKEAGLDDGGSTSLDLVDFVMSDNEETIVARTKTFAALVNKLVAAKVNQTFKANGRNPEKGGSIDNGTSSNVAATLGKTVADRNAAANNVLRHYLGGNK